MFKIDHVAHLSRNDVVHLAPERQAWNSLPLGNGRVGAASWQPDDLMFQVNARGGALAMARIAIGSSPGLRAGMESYHQRLSLHDATLVTESVHADGRLKLLAWISANEDLLVIQMEDDRSSVKSRHVEVEAWRSSMKVTRSGNSMMISEKDWALALEIEGGAVQLEERPGRIFRFITPSGKLTVKALFVGANGGEPDPLKKLGEMRADYKKTSLTTLRMAHCKWWANFWQKSMIRLHSKDGRAEYMENLWTLYLYSLASGSRGEILPPHFEGGLWRCYRDLQGWGPRYWNWNEQVVHWPIFAANHLELHEPYQHLFTKILPDFQRQTRALFETKDDRAASFPEIFSSDGRAAAFCLKKKWGAHPTLALPDTRAFVIHSGGLEMAMQFWWHYLYSGDLKHLRDHGYPMMKAAGMFYTEYLHKDEQGRYIMDPSDGGESFPRVRNPVNDLAGIRYVFPALIEAATLLGLDENLRTRWQDILEHLSGYPVDARTKTLFPYEFDTTQGALMREHGGYGQCPELNGISEFPLMGLGSLDYDLALRTFRAHQHKFYHANSYGWVRDSLTAARLGLSSNLLDLFSDHIEKYQHFQCGMMGYHPSLLILYHLDGTAPLATAVGEMLLQGWNGQIRVCPSIPEGWEAQFTLLAPGGFLVSAEYMENRVKAVEILSEQGRPAVVVNPFQGDTIVRDGNGVIAASADPLLRFPTQKGGRYRITEKSTPEKASPILIAGERNTGPKIFPGKRKRSLGKAAFPKPVVEMLHLFFPPGNQPAGPADGSGLSLPRFSSSPKLDGHLNDPCWEIAAITAPFVLLGTKQHAREQTEVRMGCDHEALYVAVIAQESRPDLIQCEPPPHAGRPAPAMDLDDSIEILLSAGFGGYWRFIINPLGRTCSEMVSGTGRDNELQRPGCLVHPSWTASVRCGKNAWSLEARIPFSEIAPESPSPDTTWRIGFVRNQYPSGERSSPSPLANVEFHDPATFSTILFPNDVLAATPTRLDPGCLIEWNFQKPGSPWAVDPSGRGCHGLVSGGIQMVEGRRGRALLLEEGFIQVLAESELQKLREITLAVWIKTSGVRSRRIFDKGESGFIFDVLLGNRLRFLSPAGTVESGELFLENTWTHVAATFGNGGIRIFINGRLVGETTAKGEFTAGTLPLLIGTSHKGIYPFGTYPFHGAIDDLRIHGSALSPDQIKVWAES